MSISSKQIEGLRWSRIAPKVHKELTLRGIPVLKVKPWTEETDMSVHLDGEYAGVHLQIGDGYVSAVGKSPKEKDTYAFYDIDDDMDFPTCLTKALAFARKGVLS